MIVINLYNTLFLGGTYDHKRQPLFLEIPDGRIFVKSTAKYHSVHLMVLGDAFKPGYISVSYRGDQYVIIGLHSRAYHPLKAALIEIQRCQMIIPGNDPAHVVGPGLT